MSMIWYTIILILASLISATTMHYLDKNHDNKIDEHEIKEAIIDLTKKE